MGDGTTSVVIIAAELLKRPTARQAQDPRQVLFLDTVLPCASQSSTSRKFDHHCRHSWSRKSAQRSSHLDVIQDHGTDAEFFSEMVVNAVTSVRHVRKLARLSTPSGRLTFSRRTESRLQSPHGRWFCAQPHSVCAGHAKVRTECQDCVPDFNLNKHRMQMGVQVLINKPGEIEKVVQREMDMQRAHQQDVCGGRQRHTDY